MANQLLSTTLCILVWIVHLHNSWYMYTAV
jgi:hypothetical protein